MSPAIAIPHPVTGEPLPPFLTAREAAVLLGRDEEWVSGACERGDLPALSHRPGTPWSILTTPLLRLLGFEPTAPSPPASSLPPAGGQHRHEPPGMGRAGASPPSGPAGGSPSTHRGGS